MSSWWDPYPLTATGNYTGLKRAGRGPQRLILGPWTHGDRSYTCFGDVEFGPDASLDAWAGDWRAYRLRFFDHVIKGSPLPEPPVRVFVMGGGSGRRTPAGNWTTAGAGSTPRTGRCPAPISQLTICMAMARWTPRRPTAAAAPLSFDFDPAHPVPTIGGAMSSLEPVAPPAAGTRRRRRNSSAAGRPICRWRHGPMCWCSRRCPWPHRSDGRAGEAELFVATDGPDTDFTAKLIDVYPASADYPQGYAMILTDGIMRLRYAEDPAARVCAEPARWCGSRITLFPTANLFLPGHRIRLDVSSSNFPKFDVNPNTGEPEGRARRARGGEHRVRRRRPAEPAGLAGAGAVIPMSLPHRCRMVPACVATRPARG